jgi:hypothetical protein
MVMRRGVTGLSVALFLGCAARCTGVDVDGLRTSDGSPSSGDPGDVRAAAGDAFSEEAHVVADVGFHPQERPLTCEEAALRMALEHQGIVRSEATILADVGVDPRPGVVDSSGTLRWGDPYTGFVGDPDGSERALTGYGTYYPTIARVARSYGAAVLLAGEGIAPATLYAALLAGHPAVAWIAYDWTYHPPSMPWVAFDGAALWWRGPIEHAITLVGVTTTTVLVNNPALSTAFQRVPKRVFERTYRTFGDMAVILR